MKKMMMLAMMAAAATSAIAQDALVKEAKKVLGKGEFNQAAEMLAPALTSAETTDKAAAWNLMSEIKHQQYSKINEEAVKSQMSKEAYDTLTMWRAAVAAWENALKCDEFDQLPDEKGKVKLKYRTASQNRYKIHGVALVQAGQFFYQQKNNQEALNAWKLYVGMKQTPIFAEVADFPKDPFFYDIAYYAAFLSYQEKNYEDAEKYAKITAENPEKAADANEILLFAKKENLKTPADSASYTAMLKDLHKQNPDESRYFNLLMDFYSHAGNRNAMKDWVEEEIAMAPENKMAWALKGELLMGERKWDDAVEAYKKAIELDNDFVQCVFNAGVCLNSKAIDLKDQLADKKTGGLTKENADKVKAVLGDARSFLERAKELDPDREKVNWAYPLYQIYYSLGDKAKSDEMEKLVGTK